MEFYKWLQLRLAAQGFAPGPADGIWGRRSATALEAFQRARGLPASGNADKATIAALREPGKGEKPRSVAAAPAAPSEPSWLIEARRYMGLREVAGPASNPTILGFAQKLGGWVASYYKNDDTPWCGLFVGNIMATALPHEVLPGNPLSAQAWASFGRGLPRGATGAILVFVRPGGGHVGFYVGEDAEAYHVLGGNQSNSVSITRVAKARLLATRWPLTASGPDGGPVRLTTAGVRLSTQEA